MTPIISCTNVCFSYGHHEVLHEINVTVEQNSFIGIVGPNGGGKTTLLRLLLGLEKPNRGKISLLGQAPEKARKYAGYVPQHLQYDEKFPATVQDITLMSRSGLRPIGPFGKNDKIKAHNALSRVGMTKFIKRPFAQLSGGQQQRVLIAQALAGEPKILLFDEPTANIDTEGEEAINSLLRSLAQSITVVVVSHNVNTVLDCASHVLCINRTASMNALADMQPELIERARGGGVAILHHELDCHVFDKQGGGACPTNSETLKK